MGALFCSYYINNRITRLRKAILSSQINDIKSELKEYLEKHEDSDLQRSSTDNDIINIPIDTSGNTPLILSIESRQLKSFMYLINELDADPNRPNEFSQYTPLHMCCLAVPPVQITRRFNTNLNKNAVSKSLDDLNTSTKTDSKRLMEISVMTNQSEDLINKNRFKSDKRLMTKTITKKKKIYASVDSAISSLGTETDGTGSKLGTKLSNYLNVSQKPIDNGTLSQMMELLVEKGADINNLVKVNRLTKMPGFETLKFVSPLHVAVYNKNVSAIELLIQLDCDVNICDPVSKINALHMACYMSKIEMVSLLLDSKNIDVEARSKNGFNCFHWLALSDNDENSFGIAMLIISHILKKFESMHLSKSNDVLNLLDQKLKYLVNQQSVDHLQTPLMFACLKSKLNLVKTFLDYDAVIDLKDKNGLTAVNYGKNNESCLFLLNSYNKIKRITMKKKTNTYNQKRTDSGIESKEQSSNSSNSSPLTHVSSAGLNPTSDSKIPVTSLKPGTYANRVSADKISSDAYKTSF